MMRAIALAGTLGILAALVSPTPSAQAALFTVTTTADGADVNPGDGRCATATGACTLRAAVQEANVTPALDVISIPPGTYALTLVGRGENLAATGDLDITQPLTLTAAGAATTVIDGNGSDRILHVIGPVAVEVSGITLRNGNVPRPADISLDGGGGAIYIAGGGRVTLRNTVVSGNTATSGGGIVNDEGGTLSLVNTAVTGNTASFGAGVFNNGTLNVTQSTYSGNSASASGGGIYHRLGALTLFGSTITANSAGSATIGGGGLLVAAGATASIGGSLMNANTATANGGGIHTRGSVSLANTTLSGNTARASGGAVYVGGGTVSVNNGTLAGNSADTQAAAIWSGGSVTISNTIVAPTGGSGACGGPIASLGYNLDGGSTCGLSATGDLTGMDPRIGPLQSNGGPTLTHALLPTSPAIDAGNPGTGGSGRGCEPSDQRGTPRPIDGNGDGVPRCDIGAYEAPAMAVAPPPPPAAVPVVPAPAPPLVFFPPAGLAPVSTAPAPPATPLPQVTRTTAAPGPRRPRAPAAQEPGAAGEEEWLILAEPVRLYSITGDALWTANPGARYLPLGEEDGWMLIVLEQAPDDAFWVEGLPESSLSLDREPRGGEARGSA